WSRVISTHHRGRCRQGQQQERREQSRQTVSVVAGGTGVTSCASHDILSFSGRTGTKAPFRRTSLDRAQPARHRGGRRTTGAQGTQRTRPARPVAYVHRFSFCRRPLSMSSMTYMYWKRSYPHIITHGDIMNTVSYSSLQTIQLRTSPVLSTPETRAPRGAAAGCLRNGTGRWQQ